MLGHVLPQKVPSFGGGPSIRRLRVPGSTGRYTSAEIADLAPLIHIHVFRVGKRQFLELGDETKFKMSGHSARICRHFSKSAQIKIDVFPHANNVYIDRFGPFSASFDKRSQDPS